MLNPRFRGPIFATDHIYPSSVNVYQIVDTPHVQWTGYPVEPQLVHKLAAMAANRLVAGHRLVYRINIKVHTHAGASSNA